MTLSDLRQSLRDYTIQSAAILTDAVCDELVNGVLEEMEHLHLWQETLTHGSLAYTSTDDGIALPPGFLGESALYEVQTDITDPSIRLADIPKVTREQWIQRVHASSTNPAFQRPSISQFHYYLSGVALYLVPQPTADVALVFDFFLKSAPLSDGNPTNYATEQYANLLKWGAIRDAFLFLHEEERATAMGQRFQVAFAAATKRDFAATVGGAPPKTRGA